MDTKSTQDLLVIIDANRQIIASAETVTPALIFGAGVPATTAWTDFFEAIYPNAHTRRSYNTAVRQFCAWCEEQDLALIDIRAGDVGKYLRNLPVATGSKKVHRAANKKFFDFLVERHVCLINPWSVARTEKYRVKRGLTPRIHVDEVKQILSSISRETPAGKRDHTIIAVLAGCGVRTQSIEQLRVGNYVGRPGARQLQFVFKGGNNDLIAVRHDLEGWLDDYLDHFNVIDVDPRMPFFRPFVRKTGIFRDWIPNTRDGQQQEKGLLTAHNVGRMVKRRLKDAEMRPELSAHSFRVNAATDLLEQNIPIEEVQEFLGHADARTTKVYDHSDRKVTRNLVEKIRLTG